MFGPVEQIVDDMRRGSTAGTRAMALGILAALAVSMPVMLALYLLTPIGIGGAVAGQVPVQLAATFAFAGRIERNRA